MEMDDCVQIVDLNDEGVKNMADIIARNLAENKAFLSKLMGGSNHLIPDEKNMMENCFSENKYKRRIRKKKIIEIRRNPGRKARSYAGDENTSDETTITRIPLKVKLSLGKSHDDVHQDYSNNSEVEEDDLIWEKSPIKKRMKFTTPINEIRKASDITDAELQRVLLDPRIKKSYTGAYLSTCHQCRQKTQDMKTVCRSGYCRGVQGQFCGVCLYNRYGENAREVLLDDKWSCPVCRNVCNCSFCLPKKGRRCTGILVPEARRHGFTNVKAFLDSMYGEENKQTDVGNLDDTSVDEGYTATKEDIRKIKLTEENTTEKTETEGVNIKLEDQNIQEEKDEKS